MKVIEIGAIRKHGYGSYSSSKVTMAVSVAVCEIFSVKEWCDLENRVRVRSRSLEMAPFDRSHTSSYSPSIELWRYLVSFASYSDLLVENREFFIPHLYLAPPQGVTPSEFREGLILVKLEWLGYRMVKKLWRYVKPFSSDTGRLRTDGRTDRRTDLLYQYRASVCCAIKRLIGNRIRAFDWYQFRWP